MTKCWPKVWLVFYKYEVTTEMSKYTVNHMLWAWQDCNEDEAICTHMTVPANKIINVFKEFGVLITTMLATKHKTLF